MATGTGKTYTIVNQVYRLMKAGLAKRVLSPSGRRRDHGSLLRANPIWRRGLEGGSMSRRRATKTPLRSAS